MSDGVNARGSLQRRLMIQLLLGAALLGVVLFFVVQGLARQLAEESQYNILAASATSILDASAVQRGELQLDLPYSAFSMLGNLSNDRVFYAIHADGAFLTGYDDIAPLPAGQGPAPRFETRDYRGDEVRLVSASRGLALEGRLLTLTVTLAQTRTGQQETLERIARNAGGLGFGFFLLAALLALFTARSTIGPLHRLAQSVGRRGPQDLRPVAAPVPVEMVPLVSALNRLMGRLKRSLTRSEEFIAEAAHHIRTPLATVRTQAEITMRRVSRDENRASLREMIRAIDESSRAAGQLLDHAMVSFRSDHLEEEAIDLSRLASDLADRLQPLADLRDIAIELAGQEGVQVKGDRVLIQNAVQNLLDNALKYSPAETTVTLEISVQDGQAQLQIRDRGIGFPAGETADLTRRFARGANVEGIVGSGLGLTIVDEVARVHGGSLQIANNTKGCGACVTLLLPLS